MKINVNPILKKELNLGARSIKLPLALSLHNGFLGIIAVIVIGICAAINNAGAYSFSALMSVFPIIGWVECGLSIIMLPILSASAISGERERQTLDIMLTTPVKPFAIVMGKVFTAMAQMLLFILSSIPIMAVAFVLGGLNWFNLLGYIVIMMSIVFYVASLGVLCSSAFKKTVVSIVLTFVFIFAVIAISGSIFGVLTALSQYVYYDSNSSIELGFEAFIMLFNPCSGMFDFTIRALGGDGIAGMMESANGYNSIATTFATMWIPFSLILNVAIGLFFSYLAAKRINPLKKIRYRKS